jgi:hypothetical protein
MFLRRFLPLGFKNIHVQCGESAKSEKRSKNRMMRNDENDNLTV